MINLTYILLGTGFTASGLLSPNAFVGSSCLPHSKALSDQYTLLLSRPLFKRKSTRLSSAEYFPYTWPKYASRHVWIDEYRIPCRSRGDHKHFRYWWFCGTRNRSCVILYPVIVTSWEANNWQEYQKYLKTKNYRYTSLNQQTCIPTILYSM